VRRAVILTALGLECEAVQSHLSDPQEHIHPQGTVYQRGQFPSPAGEWDVIVAEIGQHSERTAFEAERAIGEFQPEVVFFVGVAGGLKDVKIGDVVAADKIYAIESGKERDRLLPRPEVGNSSYGLVQRARQVARSKGWLGRVKGLGPGESPRAFVGPIATGGKVLASSHSPTSELIRSNYSDALAVEMEGSGLLTAAHANSGVEAIVLRGISDLLDGKAERRRRSPRIGTPQSSDRAKPLARRTRSRWSAGGCAASGARPRARSRQRPVCIGEAKRLLEAHPTGS
jgi:nucleoside phosphorylase